jgi:hypothetical protein
MSVIKKNIELRGSKGRQWVDVLFDSGASYSLINSTTAILLETLIPLPEPMRFELADKAQKMIATHRVSLDFYINNDRFSDEFIVLENLSEDAIIGAATLQKWRMKLDFENDKVIYDPKVTKLIFK